MPPSIHNIGRRGGVENAGPENGRPAGLGKRQGRSFRFPVLLFDPTSSRNCIFHRLRPSQHLLQALYNLFDCIRPTLCIPRAEIYNL